MDYEARMAFGEIPPFGFSHAARRSGGASTGFWDLFQSHADGSLSAKVMIRVGAALFAPREVVPPTLRIGNRPLADLVGKDLLVEWRAEAVVIHQEA